MKRYPTAVKSIRAFADDKRPYFASPCLVRSRTEMPAVYTRRRGLRYVPSFVFLRDDTRQMSGCDSQCKAPESRAGAGPHPAKRASSPGTAKRFDKIFSFMAFWCSHGTDSFSFGMGKEFARQAQGHTGGRHWMRIYASCQGSRCDYGS